MKQDVKLWVGVIVKAAIAGARRWLIPADRAGCHLI